MLVLLPTATGFGGLAYVLLRVVVVVVVVVTTGVKLDEQRYLAARF